MSYFAKELIKVATNEVQDRLKKKKDSSGHQGNMNNQNYNQQYPYQGGSNPSAGYPPNSGGYPGGYPPTGNAYPPAGYPPASNSPYPQGNIGFNTPQPYPQSNYGQGYPQAPQPGYPAQPSGAPYQPYGSGYPPAQPQVYPVHSSDSVQTQYGSGQGYGSTPSVKPYPNFSPNQDAEALRKAMKGFGCNNDSVIRIICARSNAQRQQIAQAFKQMYGKDLIQELKSELHGDFEDLTLALMDFPSKYDADQLHHAIAGIGTRESVLIEIMTTRTNAQIFQLKQTYRYLYRNELEQDLIGDTSGYFKRLLVSLCTGARDESNQVDVGRANHDARSLYKAGEARLGTDEAAFSAILAQQNYAQLRLVFDEYQKMTGHSIEQAIASEFSGDVRDAYDAIVKSIRNRPAYFAELLNKSMRGFGTRDGDLIRIIVTRSEIDLADIRREYQRLFGTSLENAIAGDCSGAYKNGLIALVKGN